MSTAAKRWLFVLVVTALGTGASVVAPSQLRRMQSFHVQHVEVTGARYLGPDEAVAASGITPTASVFDDFAPWRAALMRHPMVLDVAIERRLPATIVLRVTESQPLAFARVPELRPVDARGRLLTADPTRAAIDLPILVARSATHGDVALSDAASLAALRTLGRVAQLEPALFALASEVEALSDGVRLVLRAPLGAEILLPAEPDAERLHLLRLTLADVGTARGDSTTVNQLPQLRRIDARYREQIVVALHPGESR